MKATSYINDTIIDKQLNIMVPYVDIISLCHSVAIVLCRNLCDVANANYGTWSIDFDWYWMNISHLSDSTNKFRVETTDGSSIYDSLILT